MHGILYCNVICSIILHCWVDGEPVSDRCVSETANCSIQWLSEILLMKLARWSEEKKLNTDILSLRLVGVQQYSTVYERLKEKYGRYFCEVRTKSIVAIFVKYVHSFS